MCQKVYFEKSDRSYFDANVAVAGAVYHDFIDVTKVEIRLYNRSIELSTYRRSIDQKREDETPEEFMVRVREELYMSEDKAHPITAERFKEIQKEATELWKVFSKF